MIHLRPETTNNRIVRRQESFTFRPLREPLPKTPSPAYGKITLRHPNAGGSLPTFPTQPKVAVPKTSSSLLQYGAYDSGVGGTGKTDPRVAISKANKWAPTEKSAIHKEFAPTNGRDAPEQKQDPPASTCRSFLKTSQKERAVRFHQVHFHFIEEEDRSMLVMEVDHYEQQRGPPRPRVLFAKSFAERRRIHRMRHIDNIIAEEEWKAIRETTRAIQANAAAIEEDVAAPPPIEGALEDDVENTALPPHPPASDWGTSQQSFSTDLSGENKPFLTRKKGSKGTRKKRWLLLLCWKQSDPLGALSRGEFSRQLSIHIPQIA